MTYDQFIKEAKEMGTTFYLPEYFGDIFDDAFYTPAEIAELTKVSKETARRWFRKGYLPLQGVNFYLVKGIDLKQFLFGQIWPKIAKRAS
jgi:hypothetical protein